MKKKILIISQNFFPESFPINDIVFKIKKFSKIVITTFPTYPNYSLFSKFKRKKFTTDVSNYKKTKIIRIPSYPRKNNKTANFILTYFTFLFNSAIYSFFFYKKKIDYIFVYATSPVIQALIGILLKKIYYRKSKLIIWVQDLWPESIVETGYIKNKFLLKIINTLINYIYKNCDIILTQSESFKENIKKKINNKKIYYLPNPSKNYYTPNKKNNKIFNILYAGNLGKIQNLNILLQLSKKLKLQKDINFLIAGKGPEENKIHQFKKKHKLQNLKILGLKNFEEMKKIYSESNLLFLSLKKNKISKLIIPSKFQAYLSAGKPIFTTLDGEVSKLIRENNCGFYCQTTKINYMVNKILSIKNLPKKKLISMGNNGRKFYSKNFTFKIINRKLINYIQGSNE